MPRSDRGQIVSTLKPGVHLGIEVKCLRAKSSVAACGKSQDAHNTVEEHNNFVEENNLKGGFFTSAQSGDNVTTVFYDAAAKAVGIKLSAYELEFTKKVLAVTVTKDESNSYKDEESRKIEEEDLQHGSFQDFLSRAAEEEAKNKKKKRCCIC